MELAAASACDNESAIKLEIPKRIGHVQIAWMVTLLHTNKPFEVRNSLPNY